MYAKQDDEYIQNNTLTVDSLYILIIIFQQIDYNDIIKYINNYIEQYLYNNYFCEDNFFSKINDGNNKYFFFINTLYSYYNYHNKTNF